MRQGEDNLASLPRPEYPRRTENAASFVSKRLLREQTPVVEAFRSLARQGAETGRRRTVKKERGSKEDGRRIIFYSFED